MLYVLILCPVLLRIPLCDLTVYFIMHFVSWSSSSSWIQLSFVSAPLLVGPVSRHVMWHVPFPRELSRMIICAILRYNHPVPRNAKSQDVLVSIGFPAHFRHLCIQFHQFSIQFRPEKLTAFKSKVQFRQIVIHIRVLSINVKNSAFKFVNCHWNSIVCVARRVRNVGSNSSFLRTNSVFCHSNSPSVIGPLTLGDEFNWNFDENECR